LWKTLACNQKMRLHLAGAKLALIVMLL
jgi:hypothetical protein